MAKVKLGSKEFDVDCEEINASNCRVTDADCVALAARMKSGEMRRLKKLELVRLFSVFFSFVEFPPSPPLIRIISQSYSEIGDDGARAIADAMRTNSSVQSLDLVRMCCR
jgi:hypothetical protein